MQNTLFENIKNSNHYFEKHFHNTYTIGITYSGFMKAGHTYKNFDCYTHSCKVMNPGEMHWGRSKNWDYVNFYPRVELLLDIYEQIFLEKKIPFFPSHISDDKTLLLKLNLFFSSLQTRDTMLIESNLIDALSHLILKHTTYTKNLNNLFDEKKIIKNTISFIDDFLDESITLDSLAQNSGLSKYHFLRIFKKGTGMTPHSYLMNKKINYATKLIQNGASISLAGATVGFSDQSHFTKNFKKYFGYSPKKSNFIL